MRHLDFNLKIKRYLLMSRSTFGLVIGPLLFLVFLFIPQPEGLSEQGMIVAGIAVLMAIWWITEAIPIPATALIPIVLYPILDVMSPGEVTQSYAHHLIFLFMGGFMIAVTVLKSNLSPAKFFVNAKPAARSARASRSPISLHRFPRGENS